MAAMNENNLFQAITSAVLGVGFFAYVGHAIWKGYNSFRSDMYRKVESLHENIGKRQTIVQCDKNRAAEEKARERVDRDLQQLRKEADQWNQPEQGL
jgi:hypothetical protein